MVVVDRVPRDNCYLIKKVGRVREVTVEDDGSDTGSSCRAGSAKVSKKSRGRSTDLVLVFVKSIIYKMQINGMQLSADLKLQVSKPT